MGQHRCAILTRASSSSPLIFVTIMIQFSHYYFSILTYVINIFITSNSTKLTKHYGTFVRAFYLWGTMQWILETSKPRAKKEVIELNAKQIGIGRGSISCCFWADIFYILLREGREGIKHLARVVAIAINNMVVYVLCSITSITKGTHHFVLLF